MTRVIHHAGISGGKDSTALFLWLIHESGIDKGAILGSFCDTGNESQITLDYVKMLSETVHPIVTIRPERDFWALAKSKGRFPSAKARFCTEKLKMEPTRLFVHTLRQMGNEVMMYSGVRAAESDDRAKLGESEFSVYFANEVRRPLLRWSIEDVWAIHAKYNIPRNPLYDAGCKRVGCLPCVMSRKKEVGIIAQRWPERIEFIKTQEETIHNRCGYASMFHRNTVPARYRTQPIITKDGEEMMVASIDDVAKWALNNPDLFTEEFDFFEDAPACDSRYGACE